VPLRNRWLTHYHVRLCSCHCICQCFLQDVYCKLVKHWHHHILHFWSIFAATLYIRTVVAEAVNIRFQHHHVCLTLSLIWYDIHIWWSVILQRRYMTQSLLYCGLFKLLQSDISYLSREYVLCIFFRWCTAEITVSVSEWYKVYCHMNFMQLPSYTRLAKNWTILKMWLARHSTLIIIIIIIITGQGDLRLASTSPVQTKIKLK